jgi:hypothetical protein
MREDRSFGPLPPPHSRVGRGTSLLLFTDEEPGWRTAFIDPKKER